MKAHSKELITAKKEKSRETCIIWRMRYSTSGATARATSGDKVFIPMLCAITSIVSLGTMLIFNRTLLLPLPQTERVLGIWMQNANPNAHGFSSSHQFTNSFVAFSDFRFDFGYSWAVLESNSRHWRVRCGGRLSLVSIIRCFAEDKRLP